MELVQKLEAATHASLAPPDIVTPEARQEAEEVLLTFRRSKMPYHACKSILGKIKKFWYNELCLFTMSNALIECFPGVDLLF